MGVHGLWRLIEPSGRPVPLEALENQVLAVDVSIWLHHIVKGYQDSKGAAVPNAHLLGIYHRVCKLLYYRIKPVFVFDGGVPPLKTQTIALRNQQKQKNLSEADRLHHNLLSALLKHTAISKVLSDKEKAAIISQQKPKEDDIYVLPPSLDSTVSSDDDSDATPGPHYDLHSIDTQSQEFKALPLDVKHEILTDLKDTRKQNSWGRIHELPTQSGDFSTYQMGRLLKRFSVQSALEEVEKEMGGHSLSLAELEKMLQDQGVITSLKGKRIASDENTRFLLIKDIKQAREEAQKETANEENEGKEPEEEKTKNKADRELDDDLQKAIALSLEEVPSTSKKKLQLSFLDSFYESDEEEEEEIITRLTPAQRYMMEYSGLTAHEINRIISSNSSNKKTKKTEEVKMNAQTAEKNLQTVEEIHTEPAEDVDISDSASSCEDFVDVDIKNSETMEIVIKPEEMDHNDDLFKDVFEDTEKTDGGDKTEVTTNTNKEDEIEKNAIIEIKTTSLNEDSSEKLKEVQGSNIKDKTEKMVKEYAKNGEKSHEKEQLTLESPNDMKDKTEEDSGESPQLVNGEIKSTSLDEDRLEKVDQVQGSNIRDKIETMVKEYTKNGEKLHEKEQLTVERLNEMKENLQKEQAAINREKVTKERMASHITDQMCQEAQELLELFGVPYLVAPMEAEAQCAYLDLIDLTNGTITDDSDIWLFGGQTVYKNFFDQSKHVMEFKSESIQHNYKLSREQLILLAMLVGSDYTTGLTGVGPVTALEILAAFPPKTSHLVSGLAEFKAWIRKGKAPAPGRTALRGKLKNVSFTESFPNPRIVEAYLEPRVDPSREKFTWGKPDVVGLVDFAKQKFGWTKAKSEEILNPILKRMEEKRVQRPITDFFKTERRTEDGEAKMSKRVKNAVRKIGAPADQEEEVIKKKRTRKTKAKDEEIKILEDTEERSKARLEEIHKEIGEASRPKKTVDLSKLHKKEVIPQKLKNKTEMLKNKLKAIETFRKGKQGPGYVKKRERRKQDLKKDSSYLSESDSD